MVQKIWDVKNGIGISKYALNVPYDGSLGKMVVSLLIAIVQDIKVMELVQLAMGDIL